MGKLNGMGTYDGGEKAARETIVSKDNKPLNWESVSKPKRASKTEIEVVGKHSPLPKK